MIASNHSLSIQFYQPFVRFAFILQNYRRLNATSLQLEYQVDPNFHEDYLYHLAFLGFDCWPCALLRTRELAVKFLQYLCYVSQMDLP